MTAAEEREWADDSFVIEYHNGKETVYATDDAGYCSIVIWLSTSDGMDRVNTSASFPYTATDFELDHFLARVLPWDTYCKLASGSVKIKGIGENGYVTRRDRRSPISDFIPHGKSECVLRLSVEDVQ